MTKFRLIISAAMLGSAIAPPPAIAQWRTDFDKHTVPLDEITSGGPPKDGIPAIDRPVFVSVEEADRWLGDREPVVMVEHGGESKAYPLQILIWHEIVNDEIAGLPVSVTFCPLCNTALAFDRRFDGQVLDFGTTGMLRHSDLVMYDRQSETWWQQATGEGIVGTHAGRQLTFVSAPLVGWKQYRKEHPDGKVLSRETGFSRDYGRNPYQRYDTRSEPFSQFFGGRQDGRLPAMERVVALADGDSSVAYSMSALEERPVTNDTFVGRPIVVLRAGKLPGCRNRLDLERFRPGHEWPSGGPAPGIGATRQPLLVCLGGIHAGYQGRVLTEQAGLLELAVSERLHHVTLGQHAHQSVVIDDEYSMDTQVKHFLGGFPDVIARRDELRPGCHQVLDQGGIKPGFPITVATALGEGFEQVRGGQHTNEFAESVEHRQPQYVCVHQHGDGLSERGVSGNRGQIGLHQVGYVHCGLENVVTAPSVVAPDNTI